MWWCEIWPWESAWTDRFFFLFSLSRELSPFLLHEHVLNLLVSKLFILSLHSLYKVHVSCFVFSHFNSLPPASLSLLLHFNREFHDNLTRSRSTCKKCPSGINLLLVLKSRLFGHGYPTDIPLTVRNSLTTTGFKKKKKLKFSGTVTVIMVLLLVLGFL